MDNGIRIRQIIFERLMERGENRKNWEMLCCSNKPLVPFIGAGISAWCYPTWDGLLKKVVEENFSEVCADVVGRALRCKEKPRFAIDDEENETKQRDFYWMEEIAECIFDDNIDSYNDNKKNFKLVSNDTHETADVICQQLRNYVGNEGVNKKRGAIKALYAAFDPAVAKESGKMPEYQKLFPKLFNGILVTTNYDKALEICYSSIFSYSYRDLNTDNSDHPSWLFRAVQDKLKQMQNKLERKNSGETNVTVPDIPMLLKLHGSIEHASNIALSRANYDVAYRGEMPALFEQIYNNSTLIFMGCGLREDRILDVMEKLKKEHEDRRHFTFYPRPKDSKDEEDKRKELVKRYGIYPIFYDRADLKGLFSKEELDSIYHDFCLGLLMENLLRRKMYYPQPLELLWDRYRFEDRSLEAILVQEKTKKLMQREPQHIHVEEASQIWELLNSSDESPLIAITGETGSGRSTLCQNIEELSKNDKDTMQFFYISLANCKSWNEFCIQLFQRLNIVKLEVPGLEEWKTVARLVEQRCNGYWRSVLVLDQLDELKGGDSRSLLWKNILLILRYWKEHQTRVIFTCRDYPKEISCYTWHIGELTNEEAKKVFFSACTSRRYRDISFLEQKVVNELFGSQKFQPASVHLLGRYANSKNDLASLLEEWKLYQLPGDGEEKILARILWFHLLDEHGYEDQDSEEEKRAIEKNILWIWGILGKYPGIFPSVFFESMLHDDKNRKRGRYEEYKRKDLSVKTLIYMKNAGLCQETEDEDQRILLKNISHCVQKYFFSPLENDGNFRDFLSKEAAGEEREYGLECFRGYSMESFDGNLRDYVLEEVAEAVGDMERDPTEDILEILECVGSQIKDNKGRQENKKLNLVLHDEIKMVIRFLIAYLSTPNMPEKIKMRAVNIAYSFSHYFHYIPNYASPLVRQLLEIMENSEYRGSYQLASLNRVMGDIQRLLGKKKEAMECYGRAVDMCNGQMLSMFSTNEQNYKEALRVKAGTLLYYYDRQEKSHDERMKEAGNIYQRLGDRWGMAYYNQCMGEVHFAKLSVEDEHQTDKTVKKSHFDSIRSYYNQSAEIYCQVENKTGIAYILKCMGDLIDKYRGIWSQKDYYICERGDEKIKYYVIGEEREKEKYREDTRISVDWQYAVARCYAKAFRYYQGHINWRGFANVLQAMGTACRSINANRMKECIKSVEKLYGFAEECYRWLGDMRGLADTLDYFGYGYQECGDITYDYMALSKWMESKELWEAQGNEEKAEKIEKKMEDLRCKV